MKELINIAKSRGKENEEGVEGKTESKRERERDLKRWESGGGRNVCVSWQIENGGL